MDLTVRFRAGRTVHVICPNHHPIKIVQSLPGYELDQHYKGIHIIIKPSIREDVFYDVVIHFSEYVQTLPNIAHLRYIPYLDFTLEVLESVIATISWEWSLLTLPMRNMYGMAFHIMIITENSNISQWFCDIVCELGYGYISVDNVFRVGKNFTAQICDTATSKRTNPLPTHIIYLVDMEDLDDDYVIHHHHHTTIDSKKELKMLLSRIKWRWE